MKLSHRLETIASFVRKGSKIADIGTDHGYIPIYLIRQGTAVSAVAMDVRSGPLERAREHVEKYGLSDRICLRLSDGLKKLEPGEADTVIIAGMGGELMIHILEEGKHMWDSVSCWVLSPQSELDKVRHYLEAQGFLLRREEMLTDEGKYYVVMEAGRGKMEYGREIDYKYGRELLRQRHPVLLSYLQKEKRQLEGILSTISQIDTATARNTKDRTKEIEFELGLIEEALHEMQ